MSTFDKRRLAYPFGWEWNPSPEPHPFDAWTRPSPEDEGSAELEIHWLLYALISIIKPMHVFESGSHLGYSTYWLGKAVRDNGLGWVWSAEVNEEYMKTAQWRCLGLPVSFIKRRAAECAELRNSDFFFCDSNYGDRAEELALLKPGCAALVHDTNPYAMKYANGAADIAETVKGFEQHIFFPQTMRGFALLRKT